MNAKDLVRGLSKRARSRRTNASPKFKDISRMQARMYVNTRHTHSK